MHFIFTKIISASRVTTGFPPLERGVFDVFDSFVNLLPKTNNPPDEDADWEYFTMDSTPPSKPHLSTSETDRDRNATQERYRRLPMANAQKRLEAVLPETPDHKPRALNEDPYPPSSNTEMEPILKTLLPFLIKANPKADLTKLMCRILANDAGLTPREHEQLLGAYRPLDWLTSKLSAITTSNTWHLWMKPGNIKKLINCLNQEKSLAKFQTLYKNMHFIETKAAATSESSEPPPKKLKREAAPPRTRTDTPSIKPVEISTPSTSQSVPQPDTNPSLFDEFSLLTTGPTDNSDLNALFDLDNPPYPPRADSPPSPFSRDFLAMIESPPPQIPQSAYSSSSETSESSVPEHSIPAQSFDPKLSHPPGSPSTSDHYRYKKNPPYVLICGSDDEF